jgi:hypothetical protein
MGQGADGSLLQPLATTAHIPAGAVAEDCPWGMREARLTNPNGNEVRVGSLCRNGNRQPKTRKNMEAVQGGSVVGVSVISQLHGPPVRHHGNGHHGQR